MTRKRGPVSREWRLLEIVRNVKSHRGRVPVLDYPTHAILQSLQADPARFPGIGAACRRAGVSPSHFYRHASAALGMPPSRYVRWVRIYWAIAWIASAPEEPLDRIAERVGYRNQGSLSRTFQRETRHTPRFVRGVIRAGLGLARKAPGRESDVLDVERVVAEVNAEYESVYRAHCRRRRARHLAEVREELRQAPQITSAPQE